MASASSILSADESLVLIIDVQQRLLPAIEDSRKVLNNCRWLVDLATRLGIDLLATIHCPDKLGGLVQSLSASIAKDASLVKRTFNSVADANISQRISDTGKTQVLVAGLEAHVCVMQTCLALMERNYQVFLFEDAVGSRHPEDKHLAMQRLCQQGAQLLTREMIFFEWIKSADYPGFGELMNRFIKQGH